MLNFNSLWSMVHWIVTSCTLQGMNLQHARGIRALCSSSQTQPISNKERTILLEYLHCQILVTVGGLTAYCNFNVCCVLGKV